MFNKGKCIDFTTVYGRKKKLQYFNFFLEIRNAFRVPASEIEPFDSTPFFDF